MKPQNQLTPIPTPVSMKWREFKTNALPVCIFLGVVGLCVLLWTRVNSTQGMMGVAEGTQSTIVSLQSGTLLSLHVKPFEKVEAGQPLGVVQARDVRAQLDLLSSDLQIARLGLEPSVQEEVRFNADRIQLELLRLRSDLSVARVGLQRAESEVKRSQPLHAEKLVSDDAFELMVKTRDMIQAEVDEKQKAVAILEARMKEMSHVTAMTSNGVPADVSKVIGNLMSQRNAAGTNFSPQTLHAPMAGMVGTVFRRTGENVVEGEPILQIQSLWSERVVAYVRQPYAIQPEVGQTVQILTQERRPRRFQGIISQIGAQVEPITNALALVAQGKLVDVGLPVVIDIPPDAHIRPGETLTVQLSGAAPQPESPARASRPGKASTPVALQARITPTR